MALEEFQLLSDVLTLHSVHKGVCASACENIFLPHGEDADRHAQLWACIVSVRPLKLILCELYSQTEKNK